jgi:1,4-alpha-glucan branching enzyme
MGGEFGQWREWNHDSSLDWHMLDQPSHQGAQRWARDLNQFYRKEPALYEQDFRSDGFEWVDFHDSEKSTLSFLRRGRAPEDLILVVCNFTPVPRANYRVGVPEDGFWKEVLNSDAKEYGGSGHGNFGGLEASPVASHGKYYSLSLNVPPLGAVFFKWASWE